MGGRGNAVVGGVFFLGGIVITVATFSAAEGGGTYVVAWGAIVFGFIQMIRGFAQMSNEQHDGPAPAQPARLLEGSITGDDYPARAMRDELEGKVVVGFEVDQQGGVQNAHVAQSSGHDVLDDAALSVIGRRFRFEPARDAAGNPVIEHRQQTVAWQLN